jgi:hypothetical protein
MSYTYEIVRSPADSGLAKWLVLLDGEPYVAWSTKRQARRCIRQHKRPITITIGRGR